MSLDMFNLGLIHLPEMRRRHSDSFEYELHRPSRFADIGRAAAEIDAGLAAIYRSEMWLSMDAIVDRAYAAIVAHHKGRGGIYRFGSDSRQSWTDGGRQVRAWLDVGIVVEEAGPAGERGWRRLRAEPTYIEEGTGRGRLIVKVRGLPPEQQATRYALEERRRRTALRFDEKARCKRQPEIDQKVREILCFVHDFLVPPFWAQRGFVDQALVGERLDAAADIVRCAHHLAALTRPQLDEWIRVLAQSACDARHAERPTTIALPAEDAAALESLL